MAKAKAPPAFAAPAAPFPKKGAKPVAKKASAKKAPRGR